MLGITFESVMKHVKNFGEIETLNLSLKQINNNRKDIH